MKNKEKSKDENIVDDVVKNVIEENISEQKEQYVYCIQCGNNNQEFYSYVIPTLSDDKITISHPFKKGIVEEIVMDKTIEEYYYEPMFNEINFDLIHGILLQKHKINDLSWITRCDIDAKNAIKDKIIIKYQKLIPVLMDRINRIEGSQKSVANNKNDIIEF